MKIVDYFSAPDRAHWLAAIRRAPWPAAAFLASFLERDGAFAAQFGPGATVLLLTDGDDLASFCTYAARDEVDDPALTPWIGFAFTFDAYRGRRCLGMLIERAMTLAAADGHPAVYISTDHVGLYEKYGFSYVGAGHSVWNETVRVYRRPVTPSDKEKDS